MKRIVGGFTLLEVMIALAFIGLALVAVVRTQGQAIRLADEARYTSRAVFLARTKLAEIQETSELNLGIQSGRFEQPLDSLGWEAEVSPMPVLPGLFKVQVWVHPVDRPPRQGVTLEGFAYRGTP